MKLRNTIFIFCFILTTFIVFAEKPIKAARADELISGQPRKSTLELDGGFGIPSDTFTFKVPKHAYAVRISIDGSAADLDLFLNPGSRVDDYAEAVYKSEGDSYNESIFITRQSELPLESGLYFVDVAYQYDFLPVSDGEKISSLDYMISIEIISAEPDSVLLPGQSRDITLRPETGMFHTLAVDIPRGTESFRIDVYNTDADIDIFAAMKAPAKSRNEALYSAESMLGRETLVVGSYSGETLASGRYYISLMDQLAKELSQKLSIIVTLDKEAPDFLLELPAIPNPEDSLEAALLSTVEIISSSKGSGCLVSSKGLLLTNWHVIVGPDGKPSRQINVAVSLSNYHPPRELFTADVVAWDEKLDLALLRITGGIYGNKLPYGYSFPYFKIGDPSRLRIGQPIGIIGYPEVGGTGSRTSITFTSGIVSGFENAGDCSLVKTDALINSGNSGGAVIDAYHELLGIPGYVMDIDNDKMGYIYPVSCMPADWITRITADNHR
ncbi:MAG: trypsin-like peptidase domain-containing protein [Spirochaetales bacterium]|nr:trypsin-like peptidase domain-containing protein [Spirochaetales bacterium]